MDTEQNSHQPDGVPPPSLPSVEPQGEHDIKPDHPDEIVVSTGSADSSLAPSAAMVAKGGRPSEKLANRFASLDAEKTKKVFSELNEDIRKKSDAAVSALETAADRWEELAPKISEMQSLLSQRGEKRRAVLKQAGLPTWTRWVDSFTKQHGLGLSLRAIQKRLAKLRNMTAGENEHTPEMKRRAIKAAGEKPQRQKGHDAAQAKLEKQLRTEKKRYAELHKCVTSLESENQKLARKVQQLQTDDGKAPSRLVSPTEKLKEFVNLSMKAFEIVNGKLGDRLMASDDGKRLLEIARKVTAMKGKLKIR